MYKQVFQRIIDASQNNSLTFFVGAGVSALSDAPKWSDLINDICREMGREPNAEYTSDEYLRIPQMYYYSIDKDNEKYYTFLKGCFEKGELVPNTIHKMLLRFNPCSFITTNFDELLEDAAIQSAQGFKSIACDSEIASINGDRYILKVHGDLKHKNIVFKEEDYLNYSEKFKLTETVLKSIFSMNTVVFIGYGLNDYNIKLVLNWAKTLLNDQFNEPIFIHTGSEELSREELLYQESKGVKVVECKKCKTDISEETDYLERYKCVLDAIAAYSSSTVEGKSDSEAFDVLYELLSPLDKLNALRKQDVHKKIGEYVYIGENGVISLFKETCNLLRRYSEINNLSDADLAKLEPSAFEKYKTISSVFLKARITHIREEHTYTQIKGSCTLGDLLCTSFDYCGMHAFCKRKRHNVQELYQQAYYLAKMMRYEEAFFLFLKVAQEAFKRKDYCTYYLAQINCNSLQMGMESLNRYYRCYDMDQVRNCALTEDQVEHLFDKLPTEFINTYASLKDLHSPNLLYKYFYNAYIDGKKLQNAIESNALEMGLSSSGKAMCRINDYLHFLLCNGLYLDEFTEFKSAITNLMGLLVYKYSEQNKKKLLSGFPEGLTNEKVEFDEFDFYCFVEYFESKDILKLLNKYEIETIEFQNIDAICDAVTNLLQYYDQVLEKSKDFVEVISYQGKIKTCLTLLRFMNIPQKTVDAVCQFILKREYREILINDKVLFLDQQLYRRKMYSAVTAKLIEDKLLFYIDSHIKAIEDGTKFELMSTSSSINYCNLVHYISSETGYHSRRLAMRVSKIIKLENPVMLRHVVEHYSHHVSPYQKAKLVKWAKESLKAKFDFKLLTLLVDNNAKISAEMIAQFQDFLRKEVGKYETTKNGKKSFEAFPEDKNLFELNQAGYWCFLGYLKKAPFSEFLGKSDIFDFYFLFTHFDFAKFDVTWLIASPERALILISKRKIVRQKVREKIAEALQNGNLSKKDEAKLAQILAKHFC